MSRHDRPEVPLGDDVAAAWTRFEGAAMMVGRSIRRYYDHQFAPLGVNLGEAMLLAFLVDAGPLSQIQLARSLDTGKATTAFRVDALVKCGAVQRRQDPDDRRAWLITPTPKGRRLAAEINRIDEQVRDRIREGIGRDERRAFALVANRVRANIDAALDEPLEPESS